MNTDQPACPDPESLPEVTGDNDLLRTVIDESPDIIILKDWD